MIIIMQPNFTTSSHLAQNTPFENPAITLVHMIIYAIGIPDVRIFRLSNDNPDLDKIPYPELSYALWLVFAIIMSVLFLNLLVSYATFLHVHSRLNAPLLLYTDWFGS